MPGLKHPDKDVVLCKTLQGLTKGEIIDRSPARLVHLQERRLTCGGSSTPYHPLFMFL